MQMSGNALFGSGGGKHRITIGKEVGANNGVPLKTCLLEIRGHLGGVAFISRLDYSSVRDSTHVTHIFFVGFRRVRSQAFQPIVVVHCQSVALKKKWTAKEINEHATVFKKLHQLEQTCLNVDCQSLKQRIVVNRI